MIHHMSMPLPDPAGAAPWLAKLTGGLHLRAPTPPFPCGAWFVCLGDDAGGMLELLPDGVILDPGAPLGLGRLDGKPGRSASHVLVATPFSHAEVVDLASAQGWRAEIVDTGLFAIVKVWVQDAFLIEFIEKGEALRYRAAFGPHALSGLDGKLRQIERDLAAKLAEKLPAAKIAHILGMPAA